MTDAANNDQIKNIAKLGCVHLTLTETNGYNVRYARNIIVLIQYVHVNMMENMNIDTFARMPSWKWVVCSTIDIASVPFLLYFNQSLLIILQGVDASGKD
jgi:hypothetical protein